MHNRVSSRATDVLEPTLSNLPNSDTFATLIGDKVYKADVQIQRLKHRIGEVGGFFGTKKVTALPSPRALTC